MGRHSGHGQPSGPQPGPRGHRGRRKHHPVRTGLLASSAAMAVGAVAASSGMLSGVSGGLDRISGSINGDGAATQADGSPPGPAGSDLPSPLGGTTTAAYGGGTGTNGSPPVSSSPHTAVKPTATPTRRATTAAPTPTRTTAAPTKPVVKTTAPATTAPSVSPSASSAISSARAQILTMVNQQRATAGCQPLTASSALNTLAQNFSEDMQARNFFDHTDPDGHTPWDRAAKLGITNLGGENIARGQADAAAVMDAWMNSPGHRANILNCEYKTLGVGIDFASGGPWWTQDFGY